MTGRVGTAVQKDDLVCTGSARGMGTGLGCDYFRIGKFRIAGRNFCEN
jgi:hypothetical protein